MPRSRQVSHQATVSFMVKAYRISKTNFTSPLSIVTTASHPPRWHDVHCLPLVEHGFSGWPVPEAYIHDCDVVYARTRYRVFFQRHCNLPMNPVLFVHGDLIIMQVGKLNTANVVNTQAGDPESTAAADDHSFVRKKRDSIATLSFTKRVLERQLDPVICMQIAVSPRSRDPIPAFAGYNSARELPVISPDRNPIRTIPFISIPLFFLMSTNLFGDSTYATLT
ncbi:hypothetical protein GGU10DRAFT_337239 [Lentinula aff. detonsa]|uniref:Uncharacterized protein n=1 Tax=Lentinula aff. detonsa TaxID=2804958 RepID=A0AA38K7N1_9AGAR|nr:hypothetical protein GGU10DRAFT_337239 [Lentinula aff. detonsa]